MHGWLLFTLNFAHSLFRHCSNGPPCKDLYWSFKRPNLKFWVAAELWLVPLKTVFSFSRFKPVLYWHRFLADLNRGSNSWNSDTDQLAKNNSSSSINEKTFQLVPGQPYSGLTGSSSVRSIGRSLNIVVELRRISWTSSSATPWSAHYRNS